MNPSRGFGDWQLLASLVILGGAIAFSSSPTNAQIVPDTTLGAESSVVTPQAPDSSVDVIQGGGTRGANLFHSFEQFSVPTGGTAYFNNAADIQNIFGRVTGSSVSDIDGLLRANGVANLFLINPNGIIFGPNASLGIGGSFVGSTASSLNFADDTQFSATAPQTTPLLTISVPIGLQYGANAGRILVQGNLRVEPNQTLALVGGDVGLFGGTLKTSGGRIELGSVTGTGLVRLSPTENGFSLNYEGMPTFGDIQLSAAAVVDASGEGAGDVQVWGRQLILKDGSQIEASTLGAEAGGTLNVTTSESVEVIGTTADGQFFSGLFAQVYPGATGTGGNLTVKTGRLLVRDGAAVSASTQGGAGGKLSVTASDAVEVIGNDQSGSGLFAATYGAGAAGDLTIATGRLLVRDGAQVSAATFGSGAGGKLSVTASDTVELIGSADGQIDSGLSTQTQGAGAAGDLTIATERLLVRDGAVVSASTLGSGAGGKLSVAASDTVELIGTSADDERSGSGLVAATAGAGPAGDLTIATGRLLVRDGARVSTATFGSGAGGNLSVTASDAVELIGTSADGRSGSGLIAATADAGGAAGDLTITTGRLLVRDGAQVSADTFGIGPAGKLSVTASDAVEVIGTSADGHISSGLFAQVKPQAMGNGGNLTIETGRLIVQDKAQVAVSSEGKGAAGNLEVVADSIRLDNQGRLTADTTAGQGNIILRSEDLVLRRNSNITTNATGTATGGNITIDTGVIAALENSDISANANEASGGQVRINAQGIFGTEFRNQPTSESDITASSTLGTQFSGIVEINTSNVDLNQGLITLPLELVNVEGLIANSCIARSGEQRGNFNITGAGGLPTRPGDAAISPYPTGTVRSIPSNDASLSSSQTSPVPSINKARQWKMGDPIVEPEGVYRLANGELVLSRECSH